MLILAFTNSKVVSVCISRFFIVFANALLMLKCHGISMSAEILVSDSLFLTKITNVILHHGKRFGSHLPKQICGFLKRQITWVDIFLFLQSF